MPRTCSCCSATACSSRTAARSESPTTPAGRRCADPRGRSGRGHLYEWCWLLHEARRVTGLDLSGEAGALYELAERRGLDAGTRLADDALAGDGLVPSRSFRIWPQTEALKAQLAMFEHQGLDTRARVAQVTDQLLDRYLAVEPAGAWCDRFGPGFQPVAKDIPASILYHLLLAFSELLRLEPQLSKAAPPG